VDFFGRKQIFKRIPAFVNNKKTDCKNEMISRFGLNMNQEKAYIVNLNRPEKYF